MKACAALPWRSARIGQSKCRLPSRTQSSRRSSTSTSTSTERRQNPASPIVANGAATATFPNPDDIDQQNKTIATAVGDLPLSPIMDPSYWQAITRHQTPKQNKGKAQNSVERQFRKNPYARALAMPIRRCPVSRTRLPSFFLQDFNFIAHPETGQPWWVPTSLAWEQPADSQQANTTSDEFSANPEEYDNEESESLGDGGEPDAPPIDPSAETPAAVPLKAAKPFGPAVFVLGRQDLLSAITTQKPGFKTHTKSLLAACTTRYKSLSGKAVWRQDMDSFILDRMRHGIVQDLVYLSRLCTKDSRHYVAQCHGWGDVRDKSTGSVLWLGDTAEPGETAKSGDQPGPFATYDITNDGVTTSVAVHNIPMLLGTEHTKKVREEATVFSGGSLFQLAGRRTTNVQVKLWKLQGYLSSQL
ncbi:hypothetical protein F4859DRAFT_459953 [Xylaria cf. heliscus]|nr:hypothetical protein F4859DRAFT_459953 [Xylaria cf. heliscus]